MSQIDTKFPFPDKIEDRICTASSNAITRGTLVYKLDAASDVVDVVPTSNDPIGPVGIALNSVAASGTGLRVRFRGRVTVNDLAGATVYDTSTGGVAAAGDAFSGSTTTAGIMVSAAATVRRYGFNLVKSTTVGEVYINGLAS